MAIYIRGMSRNEIIDLTQAMADSGDQLSLHDVADAYSRQTFFWRRQATRHRWSFAAGGSVCVPVGKMSGRGLGSSGGTLDKMESISGWSGELSLQTVSHPIARDRHCAGKANRPIFAPADGKIVRPTRRHSDRLQHPADRCFDYVQKLAAGADGIVLDVKVGSGAFMKTLEEARELAEIMVTR